MTMGISAHGCRLDSPPPRGGGELLCALFAFLLLFLNFSAHAASGAWQRDEAVSVRLISALEGVGQETQIPLGLEILLGEGWHTYWRSPGDAGLPPHLDWKGSTNLASAVLLYPAPHRHSAFNLETIGYRDHVILPIDATVKVPGEALAAKAELDLLVCSDICVPKHFSLSLEVPAGAATHGAEAPLLEEARAQVPTSDPAKAGLTIADVQRNADSLRITAYAPEPFTAPDVFVETEKSLAFAKPEIELGSSDKPTAVLTVKLADKLSQGVTLESLPMTLTLVDGNRALEQQVGSSFVPPPMAEPHHATLTLGFVLLIALLGGFILNLMPCVLPVLSLKILSVVSHGGGMASRVRRSFLTTAAGVVFSFLVLAAVTVMLKETGRVIGWGVQFQSPLFLTFLLLVLTFFAANLWGLFEIPLPRFLADRLDPAYHPKLAGDFATGALATLLATPCTAPFLGTAIGFALGSGNKEIFLIFAALGLGMALPYLAIAIWPRVAMRLPRPGHWMLTLRRILGWALALTAAWLVWVLMAEISVLRAWLVGSGLAMLIGFLYLHRRPQLKVGSRLAMLAMMLGVVGIATTTPYTPVPAFPEAGTWRRFDEAAIARHVAEGKTVFVDVTADWCLTCKANKKFTLESEEIAALLFQSSSVVPMQADWTNPDPLVTSFLKKYGRYGIPFNAVFGPGAPQGVVLPELLTPGAVREALGRAGKKP